MSRPSWAFSKRNKKRLVAEFAEMLESLEGEGPMTLRSRHATAHNEHYLSFYVSTNLDHIEAIDQALPRASKTTTEWGKADEVGA